MQLINEQYKIVKEKAYDSFGITYLVEDIQKGNLLKYMRIINLQNNTKDFIEYMKYNFSDYSQYSHRNLMDFFFFNRIRSIDHKQVYTNQYYCTYGYFEGTSIKEYCVGKDAELILKLVADLCTAAKFLHLRGLLIHGLDIDDLQVITDETGDYLKVLSLPCPKLESGKIVINNENPGFMAPEIDKETGYSVLSDIYLIGAIIFNLFSGFRYINEELQDILSNSHIKGKELIEDRLMKIVRKCTAVEPSKRFQSVEELISRINDSYGQNYSIIEKQFLEKMPRYRIKPIARYNIINEITNNIKEHFFAGHANKTCMVMGFEGSGKDNFLEASVLKMEHEGFIPIKVILSEADNIPLRFSEILSKSMIKYADKELIDKYIGETDNILSMIGIYKVKQPDIYEAYSREYSKESIIQKTYNFIMEASNKFHYIVVIDNSQWIDEESKELIEEILKNQNSSKIYFIFVTDREVYSQNIKLREFCKRLKEISQLDIVKLKNFNLNETSEFIRFMLGMGKTPQKFSRMIYSETEGRPDYIYNTIYMLFSNNIIYVDDRGLWSFERVDGESLKVAHSDDLDLWNNVYKLSPSYQEILKVISIFNMPASIDIIESFIDTKTEELIGQLNYLYFLSILIRTHDELGIAFGFSSQTLKKSIYESLPSYSRYNYHVKAINVLRDKFSRENRENENELINQMLKAKKDSEAKEYINETVEEMLESKSLNQAIQFLENANTQVSEEYSVESRLTISKKLGELYEYKGEYVNAIFHYETVLSIGRSISDSYLLTDGYIRMYSLLYKLEDIKAALKYLSSAKKLLRTIDYHKGMYELIISMKRMMLHKRKYHTYIKIVEKALSNIDKEKCEYIYARLLAVCGRFKSYKGLYLEGLSDSMESIQILEGLGNYRKMLYPLNSIGSVYYNYYNDKEKAREYYEKCLDISQKVNDPYYMGVSYNNLAEIYRMEDKCSEALQYYQKSLKDTLIMKDKYGEFVTCLNIVLTNIELEDYNKAFSTFFDMEKEFTSSIYSGNFMDLFYLCKAEFYYIIGDFERTIKNAQNAAEMGIRWGVAEDSEAFLIKLLSEAQLSGKLDYDRDNSFLDRVFGENLYKLGRTACVRFAELYLSMGRKEQAQELLNRGLEHIANIDTDMLRLRYKYIGALIEEDEKRLEGLVKLAGLVETEEIENNEIKWKIYKAISTELIDNKNYREALKYLITSLNYLRKLVHNVPDEYKVRFINSHERSSVKESLSRVAELLNVNKTKHTKAVKPLGTRLNLHQMEKYFDYTEYRDIYRQKEKDETTAIESIDTSSQMKFLGKIQELVGRFSDDEVSNLKQLINLLAETTQAKNAFIAALQEDDSLSVIASYNRYSEAPFYKYLIEQVKQKKDSIIVKDTFEYNTGKGDILIPKDITAVFCIPVMISKENDSIELVEEKRRYREQGSGTIIAYIYLDTDSIINNFTKDSSLFCIMASKIAYVLADNYNMKIISTVDKLTRLNTRKYFEAALSNELMYMEKENGKFSIIMADIDKFKTVNDRFGHQKGDEVLQNISSIIMNSVRKGDICGRYGGEEIIILLPGTGAEGARGVAEKIRKKVEDSKLLGLGTPLTISLGVSSYPEHGTWVKDLIDKADQALYYVKESGRNGSRIYEANMSKSTKRIDRLAGIISGDLVEDQRKVETMLEILELQRDKEITQEEKMFNFLGRVIEVSEAQTGAIFYVEETKEGTGSINRKLMRKKLVDIEVEEAYYNESILQKCIETKLGEYQIDWSGYPGVDSLTGMPDWQSVIAVPMIDKGRLRGVVYLSVSIKNKEFDAGNFNYVKTLADIMAAAF